MKSELMNKSERVPESSQYDTVVTRLCNKQPFKYYLHYYTLCGTAFYVIVTLELLFD